MAPPAPPAVYYAIKEGEIRGPFSRADLEAALRDGHLALTDFIQRDGFPIWQPLAVILDGTADGLAGAVAPSWRDLLTWAWRRLYYHIDEQTVAAGAALLALGLAIMFLAQWPAVFWIPCFGGAAFTAVLLMKRERPRPGVLVLLGAVLLPIAFLYFPTLGHRPGQGRGEVAVMAPPPPPPAPAAGPAVPEKPPSVPAPATAAPTPAPAPAVNLPAATPEPSAERAALPPGAPATPAPAASSLTEHAAGPGDSPLSAPVVPPAPAPAAELNASFLQQHSDALAVVRGVEGSGSSFICQDSAGTWLYTNAHVAAGIERPVFTRLDGSAITPGPAALAVGYDLLRFALAQPPAHPLQVMTDFVGEVALGDEIFVLGNSGGGGVVTELKGRLVGIGPDRIEVTAEFIPGNSGSPVIHRKTGKVIGIATFLTRRYDELASPPESGARPGATPAPATPPPATPPPWLGPGRITPPPRGTPVPFGGAAAAEPGAMVIRRFAYRVDNVRAWEPIHWAEFRQEAEQMRQISLLTGDIFDFLAALRYRRAPHFETATLRRPATEWLATLENKRLSEVDRKAATGSFLRTLGSMVHADVSAADARLRCSYFRENLRKERIVRDELSRIFNNEAAAFASPASRSY